MKIEIFFLIAFTLSIVTGLAVDWSSWFFGLASGLAVYRVAVRVKEQFK